MTSRYNEHDMARFIEEGPRSSARSPFERDRARVLHSSALRRLGAKTQVLGPESDDFIRTRLTHSLEVAQIGRSFASNLGADPDVVETACLCHDLGHPPFGHNGERALAEAAAKSGGFEGNAQTLRILTRLEPKRLGLDGSPAGLNLTRATLDATIKYPWTYDERPRGASGEVTAKFNVYSDDLPVYEWIREGAGKGKSFEAQIMDLSDDIAYSVHDVEDAIVRGSVPADVLCDPDGRERIYEALSHWYGAQDFHALDAACDRLMNEEEWPSEFTRSYANLAAMKDLTSDLIGRFISSVTRATREYYGDTPLGRYSGNVIVPEQTHAEILILKGIAVAYVMEPREQDPDSDYQRSLLLDLVDALEENPRKLEPHFHAMWRLADDDMSRRRVVIDQIASLTDQSARSWHSQLCGMLRH